MTLNIYSVYMGCVFVCGRKRHDILTQQPNSKMYHITLSENILCATRMKSKTDIGTTTPGGVWLLSHVVFKINNELKQIGGNFDSRHSLALHAKINGGRGHLHTAYLRQAMFDLWRFWVVSMSQRRTFPFWERSAPHVICVHRTDSKDKSVRSEIYFQILIRFFLPLSFF